MLHNAQEKQNLEEDVKDVQKTQMVDAININKK